MSQAMITISLIVVFLQLWKTNGNFIQPSAHTLSCPPQSTINGSIMCGCPSSCIQKAGVWTCGCTGTGQYGYIIDGNIPSIDVTSNTWASHLFTWNNDFGSILLIGFQFQNSIMLREVELYIFYCPAWDIGFPKITFFIGRDFPNNIKLIGGDLGRVILTSDMQNCATITKVSIPLRIDHESTTYSLEFETSTPSSGQWIHIAEIKFSDQLIPSLDPTTMQPDPISTQLTITSKTNHLPAPPITATGTPSSTQSHNSSGGGSSRTTTVASTTSSMEPNATNNFSGDVYPKTTFVVIGVVLVLAGGTCAIIILCVVCVVKIRPFKGVRIEHEEMVPCLHGGMGRTEDEEEEGEDGEDMEEEPVYRVKQDDVHFLANELVVVAARWRQIGLCLGFVYGEMDNISSTGKPVDECLTKMLADWAEWPNSRHLDYPTVDKLCEALRSRLVGAGAIANKLESKRNQLPSIIQKHKK